MNQLTLSLDPGLQRFSSLRECLAASVYARGLKQAAADMDVSPSALSMGLGGERSIDLEKLEAYIAATGDIKPVLYLAGKYLSDAHTARQQALAQLPGMVEQIQALLEAAK